jgi:hypothetical protein
MKKISVIFKGQNILRARLVNTKIVVGFLSVFRNVQIGSGAHPAPFLVDTVSFVGSGVA